MRGGALAGRVLGLERTRSLLRGPRGALVAAGLAIAYLLVSFLEGGMLRPAASGPLPGSAWALSGSAGGWTLWLPFGPTLVMGGIAAGVGVGMGAGLLLVHRLFVVERTPSERARSLGPLAALTPAMVAVLTVGACCSTAAAALAGVGAGSSLTSGPLGATFGASWALTAVQAVVLALALLGQEGLLRLFPDPFFGALARPEQRTLGTTRGELLRVDASRVLLGVAVASAISALLLETVLSPAGTLGLGSPLPDRSLVAFLTVLALLGLVVPACLAAASSRRGSRSALRKLLALGTGLLVWGAPLPGWESDPTCGLQGGGGPSGRGSSEACGASRPDVGVGDAGGLFPLSLGSSPALRWFAPALGRGISRPRSGPRTLGAWTIRHPLRTSSSTWSRFERDLTAFLLLGAAPSHAVGALPGVPTPRPSRRVRPS
jgi:hypothetical protein